MKQELAKLLTEKPNENSQDIDLCGTEEILRIINAEDSKVAAAVQKEIPEIAKAVDEITGRLKKGGRLFYFGAGTSGRIGVLDASECPPTYGTDPELVQAYIAGGDQALRRSVEGCEDDEQQGASEIELHQIGAGDAVIGLTASGRAPYVIGVIKKAREAGAFTVGVVTNPGSVLSDYTDVCIAPEVGEEVIAGSTRMKSGTAQKMVLNMISTSVMIKRGKVYSNLMVDLKAANQKLRDRAERIFMEITGESGEVAREYLKRADMDTKLAILMFCSGKEKEQAEALLEENDDFLRKALAAAGRENKTEASDGEKDKSGAQD